MGSVPHKAGLGACLSAMLGLERPSARSFDEAVTRAINLNGDADSFGSIAGGLMRADSAMLLRHRSSCD